MKDLTQEQKEIVAKLQPSIEKLVRKVNSAENLNFTGFIYGTDPSFLIHIGNLTNTGIELIHIHYSLACLVAELHDKGLYKESFIGDEPSGSTPEEIADKLAVMLISGISNEHPDQVMDVAKKYIESRRPKLNA